MRCTSWLLCAVLMLGACGGDDEPAAQPLPDEIAQILDKPLYRNAVWGLRVVDLDSGRVIHDLHSERPFLIGSVRKLFSVGVALDTLGADHVLRTPVHRQGEVDASGVLNGDLILVASGDLAMGGRTNPDGSLAISDLDHNEANALGNAQLTAPDPLAGFDQLAAQVAAAGVRRVAGDVVIDDRLFEPFDFRGEFDVRPIFVNDDVVDVIVDPGAPALVDWRPKSAAFTVQSTLASGAAGSKFELDLVPKLPSCIGTPGCSGTVSGTLPADFVPPLTGQYPLVRTFRIVEPANYARTVLIEALQRAGVAVDASPVAANPVQVLPTRGSYQSATELAHLDSSPYKDYAKYTLKVSYNLGADVSLMLFGVAKGVDTLAAAQQAELDTLQAQFGIASNELHFVDGSGGGETSATNAAVIELLSAMSRRPTFPEFLDAQPRLGVDGSLALITDFLADPTLAGARGEVHAKTGTFLDELEDGALILRAQALAGYIDAKSGRRLAFNLVVNDVSPIAGIDDVVGVFQDQGRIAAILWKTQ